MTVSIKKYCHWHWHYIEVVDDALCSVSSTFRAHSSSLCHFRWLGPSLFPSFLFTFLPFLYSGNWITHLILTVVFNTKVSLVYYFDLSIYILRCRYNFFPRRALIRYSLQLIKAERGCCAAMPLTFQSHSQTLPRAKGGKRKNTEMEIVWSSRVDMSLK